MLRYVPYVSPVLRRGVWLYIRVISYVKENSLLGFFLVSEKLSTGLAGCGKSAEELGDISKVGGWSWLNAENRREAGRRMEACGAF